MLLSVVPGSVADVMKKVILPAVDAPLGWFSDIFEKVQGKEFYIAMVFIALLGGFILSNFKIALYVGSDVSIKSKQYKLFHRVPKETHSVKPAGYLDSGKDMRWR